MHLEGWRPLRAASVKNVESPTVRRTRRRVVVMMVVVAAPMSHVQADITIRHDHATGRRRYYDSRQHNGSRNSEQLFHIGQRFGYHPWVRDGQSGGAMA